MNGCCSASPGCALENGVLGPRSVEIHKLFTTFLFGTNQSYQICRVLLKGDAVKYDFKVRMRPETQANIGSRYSTREYSRKLPFCQDLRRKNGLY